MARQTGRLVQPCATAPGGVVHPYPVPFQSVASSIRSGASARIAAHSAVEKAFSMTTCMNGKTLLLVEPSRFMSRDRFPRKRDTSIQARHNDSRNRVEWRKKFGSSGHDYVQKTAIHAEFPLTRLPTKNYRLGRGARDSGEACNFNKLRRASVRLGGVRSHAHSFPMIRRRAWSGGTEGTRAT